MAKYEIKFRNTEGALELTYEEHRLISISLTKHEKMSYMQRNWIFTSLTKFIDTENTMKGYIETHKDKFIVTQIPTDLSFEAFWLQYGNKVGKKGRAEQLWKLLQDEEKERALLYIKKYKNWLVQNPSVQMLYPETYLSQKRWENEY